MKKILIEKYREYLAQVGETTFLDISRTIDPACVSQPWESLQYVAEEFGTPKIIQIWTKGPKGALMKGEKLIRQLQSEGSLLICQLTITGFGPLFEPRVPWPVDWEGIDMMIDTLGTPKALLWRYDPVIPGISNLDMLHELAEGFSKRGVTRAAYNWGEYGLELVRERMGELYNQIDFKLDKMKFSKEIEEIGNNYGINFLILSEAEKLSSDLNLSSRGNWQYEWLVEVGDKFPSRDFMPGVFRPGCICAPSFDIGHIGQNEYCHGCFYCFAD